MALWPRNGLARKVGHGALPTLLALSSAPSFGPKWDRVMASSNERDEESRAALRWVLLRPKFAELSARKVAEELGVSKFLVISVRLNLIALGLWKPDAKQKGYKVGAAARGGYAFGQSGETQRR